MLELSCTVSLPINLPISGHEEANAGVVLHSVLAINLPISGHEEANAGVVLHCVLALCQGSPCQNSKAGSSLQNTQLISKC